MSSTTLEGPDQIAPPRSSRPLREVKGPTAVDGDWGRFVRLVYVIASNDYKLTYFGSVLGYIWAFTQPLLFFGVLYFVFAVLLKSSYTAAPDFPVLLLLNIVLFNFFQQATGASVASLVAREAVVRKMQFPRLVVPFAVVSTAAFQLVLNLIVVVLFMIVYGATPELSWLLLSVTVIGFIVLSLGFAMFLSAMYVRYRDIAPIWGVISQALYFACPIFILIDQIWAKHPGITRYYLFNPLATLLQQTRAWVFPEFSQTHTPAWYMGSSLWLLVPIAVTAIIFFGGYFVFSRMAPQVAEEM